MKLSEAIRIGAMNKPKAVCFYTAERDATCALGAAADAVGLLPLTEDSKDIVAALYQMGNLWPELWMPVEHPQLFGVNTLLKTIQHLNDWKGLTREQVADWVETVEAKLVETPESVAELVTAQEHEGDR